MNDAKAAAAEYARNQQAKKLEAIQLVVLAFGREFVFVYLWALISRAVSITASLITLSSLGSFFGISKLLVWLPINFVVSLGFASIGSGAVMNPSAAVALVITKELRKEHFPFICLIDSVAHLVGVLTLFRVLPAHLLEIIRPPAPQVTYGQAVALEFALCFAMCSWAFYQQSRIRSGAATKFATFQNVAVSNALTVVGWYYTGAIMNPAPPSGAAMAHFNFESLSVFWLGPMGGYAAAAFLSLQFTEEDGFDGEEEDP